MEWLLIVGLGFVGLIFWYILGTKPVESGIFEESEEVVPDMESWFD